MGDRWEYAKSSVDESVEPSTSVVGDDGRAAAFERLALEQLDGSYRLARAILGRAGDGEDAVHDAFETAWRKWPSLREPARFEAWFGRIVVNVCRDRLRKQSRTRTHELDPRQPGHDPLAGTEVRDELDRALARLKPEDQIVLALRYYRDLTVEDIAALMGVRAGTVMSRIHRAQARLRPLLAAHQDDHR
jgi:RNA polymerase sigma-70 factor (ECF subfamily)